MTTLTMALTTGQGLRARIVAEYREMPTLCLTIPQAARMLQISPEECAALFDDLQRGGFLCRVDEQFHLAQGPA